MENTLKSESGFEVRATVVGTEMRMNENKSYIVKINAPLISISCFISR